MKITPQIASTVSHQYAVSVKDGSLKVGRKIQLQVDRYFSWLETAEADGYYLDHSAGQQAVNFFPTCLKHTKGRLAGQPFELAPFQQFTIYNLFGWKIKETGFRRIRRVYDKRAKKNGKTAEMAGLALYCMSFDNENEAEIYIAATVQKQSRICWNQAKSYIEAPGSLLRKIGFRCLQSQIFFDPLGSTLEALEKDTGKRDGVAAHLTIADEYHAWNSDAIKENLESSSVMRTQPILYHITTAGFNPHGVCKNYEDMCVEVLQGEKTNDSLWIMIHDLDPEDYDINDPLSWQNEDNWIKANPLLGQGLPIEGIREELVEALNQPSKIPNFKTKHLNMWVNAPTVWIADEIWMQNTDPVRLCNFIKYGCAGGLDLSTNIDLTATAFVSNPDEKGFRDIFVISFCPADTIEKRSKEDQVPYRFWADLEYADFVDFSDTNIKTLPGLNGRSMKILTATPGNVIDYNVVQDFTQTYHDIFKAKWIEYDRHFADMIVQQFVEAGMKMHPFSQTISYYNFPTKEFEALILSGKLRHGGNPILRWCLSGAVPIIDTNENTRISKSHSTKRIDPLIAGIMALAGTLTIDEEEKSKYSDPNVEVYF